MHPITRSLAATALLLNACTLVAAADPLPAAASAAASSPARPVILVLFDIDMEVAAEMPAPEKVRQARDVARRQAYDAITARLEAWAARQGVGLDTALFSKGHKVDMAGRNVSYLVVEKISKSAIETTPDGPRINTRTWTATVYDTSNTAAKAPKKLGSEDFISDAAACFVPPARAIDDDCRAGYLQRLTTHLRWIDASWGEVEPAPR
jgi:hypothetical protein